MKTRLVYRILLVACIMLVFAMMVIPGQPVLSAQAAPARAPLLQDATPTPAPTPPAQTPETQYSVGSMVLVVIILLLLALLFWLLFAWSHRQEQSGYLSGLYTETIEEIEYGRLATPLREKLEKRLYHQEVMQDDDWLTKCPRPVVPSELLEAGYMERWEELGYVERSNWGTGFYPDYGTSPGDFNYPSSPGYSSSGDGGSSPEAKKIQQIQRDYSQKVRAWQHLVDIEARKRYGLALGVARIKAKEQAKRAGGVDLSALRGRGPEFVLEFTTVVVIIFAVLALGVLRILDSQQIGTLFAAIAGYVLGRATSRTQTKSSEGVVTETETRTSVTTAELAELLRAVGGNRTPTPAAPPDSTLTIKLAGTGSGTVTRSPDSATYAPGTLVTLTANANTDSHFVSWSGDTSGATNSVDITLDGNKAVTARFDLNPPPVAPPTIPPAEMPSATPSNLPGGALTNEADDEDETAEKQG